MTHEEITLGYALIEYRMDDGNYWRVSTVIKEGNWKTKFIHELESFVYFIELKAPLSLKFSVFVGSFINNKSSNVLNTQMVVI